MLRRHLAALSLSTLAVTAAAGHVSAQAPLPKPSFGVLAGVDLATLGGSDVSGAGSRTGLTAGVFATFHVAKGFGIEPELLFSQKGAHETFDGGDVTLKLDYVEIPVLARFDVSTGGMVRPFFLAGPTASFQVSCNAEESDGSSSMSASCDDINNESGGFSKKSFDVGATAGAGVTFPAGAMKLSVGVRYTHGLIDAFENADAKNRVWSFVAGLTF